MWAHQLAIAHFAGPGRRGVYLLVDRICHDLIPLVIGMYVVTAVGRREQPRRVSWIARYEIEVEHVVEFATCSNESV